MRNGVPSRLLLDVVNQFLMSAHHCFDASECSIKQSIIQTLFWEYDRASRSKDGCMTITGKSGGMADV